MDNLLKVKGVHIDIPDSSPIITWVTNYSFILMQNFSVGSKFVISHVKLQNVTAMFGTKFLDTIHKSKNYDCTVDLICHL